MFPRKNNTISIFIFTIMSVDNFQYFNSLHDKENNGENFTILP